MGRTSVRGLALTPACDDIWIIHAEGEEAGREREMQTKHNRV